MMCLFGSIAGIAAQSKQGTDTALSNGQQQIVAMAALAASGELQQLKPVLHAGLNAGITVNQAKEVMVHLYAYAGFPRSIRGLQTLMTVLEERKAKGIRDEWGAVAAPINDSRSKYERGKEVLGKLTGAPQEGPKTGYAAFSPEIEVFLKEHLFADIFERDVLTYAERELVTIAVLAAIGGVEPMLTSHMNICLHIGITPAQLQQYITVIRTTISDTAADNADAVLKEVLNNKNK